MGFIYGLNNISEIFDSINSMRTFEIKNINQILKK